MDPTQLLVLYCALIVAASLLGGWLPDLMRMTHVRMQMLMSLVGGLMLGVALLHLLPHAVVQLTDPTNPSIGRPLDQACLAAVLGLLVTFILIRFFAVHQHGHHDPMGLDTEEHQHDHLHTHQEHHHAHPHSWFGLFLGLALHTAIDGVALAASVTAEAGHADIELGVVGLATFAAILLHKPLDSLAITSLMAAGRQPSSRIHLANLAFALMCPLGALLFYFGVSSLEGSQNIVLGWALGFAAGSFLCISLADILPEIQFHSHDTVKLTGILVIGVFLAYLLGVLEPAHVHSLR